MVCKIWNEKGLKAVEILLLETSGTYSVGEEITLADIFLLPQVYKAANEFKVDMAQFPIINRVMANLKKVPPFDRELCQRE